MIREVLTLIWPFLIGIGLGFFYFGGLWLTVRLLTTSEQPVLLTMASFLLRLGITLYVFYLVMDGRGERLIASLLGFILMRIVVVNRLRPNVEKGLGAVKEVKKHGNHA